MTHLRSTKSKLIIVEGIPGSGKSTLAGFIHNFYASQNIASELFLEGDLRHPADYESVACMPYQELNKIRSKYPDVCHLIDPFVTMRGNDALIPYALAQQSALHQIPPSLYEELQHYEIYDGISVNQHCELIVERWKSFAHQQRDQESKVVFECCFFQNPGCALLARHDAGADRFIQHVLQIAEQIQQLNPILFYLKQSNVRETIDQVKTKRSQEWLDFVIWYHTEQEYGKNRGLHGYEGYLKFLEDRRELELQIIEQLPFQSYIIDNTEYDWENQQQMVQDILMKNI
ncbi:P-loop NTPase family protein [Paenibacillus guangzhouensis]|uniref:hypothetical protein n=1 Tax=Paenibacillus guangzhouensis TaxID=1473112 RepID=UPI001266B60D|nr:hypothetical protein [Paenibacillus guangzhouensis]